MTASIISLPTRARSEGRKVVAMFTLGLEGPELDDEDVAAGLVTLTFDSSSQFQVSWYEPIIANNKINNGREK